MAGGGDLDEYLEKIVEAAFKREFEQDENVVRSLPFFATALGLVVAIFTQIAPRITGLSPVAGYVAGLLLVLAAAVFLGILWCLFQIVRAREFKIPPDEEALVAWARDLVEFYQDRRHTKSKAAEIALNEARQVMVNAYAQAAVDNRKSNRHKFRYRALGFTFLVSLVALASGAVGVIFIDKVRPFVGSPGSSNGEISSINQSGPERIHRPLRSRSEAEATPSEDGSARPEVPGRSGSEELTSGRRTVNPTPAAPTSSAAANGTR